MKGVEIPVKSNILSLEHGAEERIQLPVLEIVRRDDIKRFVRASNFDVKKTSVRIVQTAAWRGRTFPVDVRKCRIELQNGQFFQQGFDRQHNPVYYFRNVCLGPWRKDIDAVVHAARGEAGFGACKLAARGDGLADNDAADSAGAANESSGCMGDSRAATGATPMERIEAAPRRTATWRAEENEAEQAGAVEAGAG